MPNVILLPGLIYHSNSYVKLLSSLFFSTLFFSNGPTDFINCLAQTLHSVSSSIERYGVFNSIIFGFVTDCVSKRP